jgi:hypothetical protein
MSAAFKKEIRKIFISINFKGIYMMEEFEDPQNSREGWEMMQRLLWTFMVEYTGKEINQLGMEFEKWAGSKTQEEMNEIFSPEVEGESVERNLEEEGPLHSKEDILRSMWKDND